MFPRLISKQTSQAFVTLSAITLTFSSNSRITLVSAFSSVSSLSLNDPSLLNQQFPSSTSQEGTSYPTLEVYNPASSTPIARIYKTTLQETKDAIVRSNDALRSWKDGTTAMKRSQILHSWNTMVKDNADDLAKIMTMESGKPLSESYGEVAYAASFIEYYAGEAIRPTSAGGGFISPTTFADSDGSPRGQILAVQEAVGVTAMITPWNFPLAMITRKVGPALAAGCTSIVKPSELTPLSAIALHNLAIRAGIPKDVFQLVISDAASTPSIGEEFCTNTIIRKISFTGSTKVGKLLMKMSSDSVKRLSLELGGNAPFIVFQGADIDQAVDAAIASKFRNAGQTCVCADRFLIHSSLETEFVSKLVDRVKSFQVGPGMDTMTTMGPLITSAAVKSVKDKVDKAIADGAECIIGGNMIPSLGPNFFEPTVLRNVKSSSRLWNTETFGPVVAVQTFNTEDEAIDIANDSTAGLASYICTNDVNQIFRVSKSIESGIVGINGGIFSTCSAPFGGCKESGLGREGSPMGISEYLETKYMFLNH